MAEDDPGAALVPGHVVVCGHEQTLAPEHFWRKCAGSQPDRYFCHIRPVPSTAGPGPGAQEVSGTSGVISRTRLQGKLNRSGIPGVRLQSNTYSSPSRTQPSAEIVPGSRAGLAQ